MNILSRFTLVLLFIFLFAGFVSQGYSQAVGTAEPVFGHTLLGISPDGVITIRRKHAGETGQYVEFLETKTGKILFSYRSTWRSTNLVWEKSGQFLCINDETATSGDFIYIFKIGPNRQITLLRAPSPEDFSFNLKRMLGEMPDPGRFTFIGERWHDKNQLLAVVSGGEYGNSCFETILQINRDGGIEVIKHKLTP